MLLLSINSNTARTQTWDTNTTWVFETKEFGPPINGNYLTYRIDRDTIIGDLRYYKVLVDKSKIPPAIPGAPFDVEINLRYADDDKVYLYDPRDSLDHLLYDFSLMAGESYMAYCDITRDEFLVRIDSTDIIEQDGIMRRVQYVCSENFTGCIFNGQIIEGMGNIHHLLPRYTFVDPSPGGQIACYNDASFSFPEGVKCDVIVSSDEPIYETIKVMPNPSHGFIRLEGLGDYNYEVIDMGGRTILRGSVNRGAQIDITTIKSGAYIVRAQSDEQSYITRVVKMN